LDGVRVHTSSAEATLAYTLAFRSGALESVRSLSSSSGKQILPSLTIATFVRDAIAKLCDQSRFLGLEGPAVFGVALLGVADHSFALNSQSVSAITDRANLVLPEAWIDDMELATVDVDSVAMPQLNLLWQSYGDPECQYYSKGKWNAKD
jgi:hypothetical protein